MKNFKLFRTGSLILALFFLFACIYIVILKLEVPRCCVFGADHYEINTFLNYWLTKGLRCDCMLNVADLGSWPKSGWVIPIDLIISDLLCWCVFIYFQFFKKDNK